MNSFRILVADNNQAERISSHWRHCVIAALGIIAAISSGCSSDDKATESMRSAEAYINTVADRLGAQMNADNPLSAFIDSSSRIQIYLTPDGDIGVSVGFLFTAAGESELACAMAHEAAHKLSNVAVQSSNVGVLRWTQEVELAADKSAAELCWQAGYDPRSLAILLSRLAVLLQSEHPEEAKSVQERVDSLHAYLNGKNWSGDLGYKKYQSIVRVLQSVSVADSERNALEQIVIGPIFAQASGWPEGQNLYDEGKELVKDFLDQECETRELFPSNEIDAFGHCWYGCEGTRRYGESTIWFLGTAREEWREIERGLGFDDHDSYTQDVANQGRGRSMADEENSCFDLCSDAARRGLLDHSAPEQAYWDCEAGELFDNQEQNNGEGDDSSGWPWTGFSWGDPHIVTGDGYAYSFQAAGEFLAIASKDDNLRVQVRQEFWPGGRIVSQNTAAAVQIHKDVVGFYIERNQLVVHVNGEMYEVSKNWDPLPGGGKIRSGYESVRLRWQDGTELKVRIFINFLNVYFEPSRTRSGRIIGLFGNFDGSSENDLKMRDGAAITLPMETSPDYRKILYSQFGNSWRVAPDESLFEYPAGMSILDFQHIEPPDGVARVASLDKATRKNAMGICSAAGIRSQPTLDNCITDVATTGEKLFANAAADAASITGRRKVATVIPGPGKYVVDRFIAKANERYFFQILDLTGSLDLSRWELIAPDGDIVFRPCLRCNQPGEIKLPMSGVYISRVVVSDQESGRMLSLSHRVPTAQIFDVGISTTILAGQPGTGAGQIEEAGAEDVYRIRGDAGDNLRVVLQGRDKSLYFGEWSLRAPDGDYLFKGILPNPPSLPIDVELPDSGVYLLRVTGGSKWPSLTNAGYGKYSISLEHHE